MHVSALPHLVIASRNLRHNWLSSLGRNKIKHEFSNALLNRNIFFYAQ